MWHIHINNVSPQAICPNERDGLKKSEKNPSAILEIILHMSRLLHTFSLHCIGQNFTE